LRERSAGELDRRSKIVTSIGDVGEREQGRIRRWQDVEGATGEGLGARVVVSVAGSVGALEVERGEIGQVEGRRRRLACARISVSRSGPAVAGWASG
jgi:hypothetical protein